MKTLPSGLDIRTSSHSRWWEHKTFPTLCEFRELCGLLVLCLAWGSSLSCMLSRLHCNCQDWWGCLHSLCAAPSSLAFFPTDSNFLGLPVCWSLSPQSSGTTDLYVGLPCSLLHPRNLPGSKQDSSVSVFPEIKFHMACCPKTENHFFLIICLVFQLFKVEGKLILVTLSWLEVKVPDMLIFD